MDAWQALEHALAPYAGRVRWERDDLGGALVFLRLDLIHLDADALNDRLHAWAKREVEPLVPGASAFVSFRHARPATHDAAELGVQEEWLGLEPTFRLDLTMPRPTGTEVAAFAALVPEFLKRVDAAGRPEGWRDVHAGNAE